MHADREKLPVAFSLPAAREAGQAQSPPPAKETHALPYKRCVQNRIAQGDSSMNSSTLSVQTPSLAPSGTEPGDSLQENVNELRQDLASLKDSFSRLASQASGEAAKAIRGVGQSVASHVGGAASGVADASTDLATTAKEHAKTFASELEGMARRNPLGTIAGAVVIGIIVGMMSRGRS